MIRLIRAVLLIALILSPIVFYRYFNPAKTVPPVTQGLPVSGSPIHIAPRPVHKVKIALIFDDLGANMEDLKNIHELDIPVTISIIPGLRFSQNIAQIADRSGMSVLIHLPMEPKDPRESSRSRVRLISGKMTEANIRAILRTDLNFTRVAVGVNNHMGSLATEDEHLMGMIGHELKKRGLVFIDSRTSPGSVACKVADRLKLSCADNQGFLDSFNDEAAISAHIDELIAAAQGQGAVILIGHPRPKTLRVFRDKLPALKDAVEFITIKEYFDL
jgi:uncharacterized protein